MLQLENYYNIPSFSLFLLVGLPTPTQQQLQNLRLYTNTTANEKQTRKFQTNKFKDKNCKKMLMNKIMENDANDYSSSTGSRSSSSSSSSNESSITSCCLSGNNCSSNSSKTTSTSSTTAYVGKCRRRRNLKVKIAGKTQRYCRRPRMSLPNIWLNLAKHEEQQNDSEQNQQQR